MEFCSKCGTILMPQKKDDEFWLGCPDCGHTRKLTKEDDYRIDEIKKERKGKGVAVVEEKGDKKRIKEPNYEIDTDAYAELYEEGY